MVFRYKSDVNGLRIGLPFFEPEKMAFANAKTAMNPSLRQKQQSYSPLQTAATSATLSCQ